MKRDRTVIWRRMLPLMVAALLTLALSSCTKEPLLSDEQQGKEYMNFSLELTPPGAFSSVGSHGACWSSSVRDATYGYTPSFSSGNVYPQSFNNRSIGVPVRCVSPV